MYRAAVGRSAVALLVLTGMSGCGSGSTYPACLGAVRYGGATYHEVGFTDREGEALQETATFATCDAVNRDGVSRALREESDSVDARSLPGYRRDQVIEVQVTDGAWSVLISEDALRRLLPQIRQSGLLDAGAD